VKAAVAMDHEHSNRRSISRVAWRRLDPARSVSDLVRGSWLPSAGSCMGDRALAAGYQDWRFARYVNQAPGVHVTCPESD
jgi:hypothetical protein